MLSRCVICGHRINAFIYDSVLSRAQHHAERIAQEVSTIQSTLSAAVAVGFGISRRSHVEVLERCGADIVVVGSAAIEAYNSSGLKGLEVFLKKLFKSTK